MFIESIRMSFFNIVHNKMRSFLTVLGVLIGVCAIITLISVVQAVTSNITGQVLDMGANKISIQIKGTSLKQGLTLSDLYSFENVENISGISPLVNGKTDINYNGKKLEDVSIQGRNQIHFINTKDLLQSGRSINILDIESKNRVCLIGENILKEFFSTKSPIGEQLRINGIHYTIVGVLQPSTNFIAGSTNNTIIIPFTTAMSLLSSGYISSVDLYLNNENLSDETTTEIKNVLNTAFNYNEDGFNITNMQNILDTVEEMTGIMSMLLAGIACISLVVGGIGIMNMMLVSVTERKSEIGLRKALGAKPKTIQLQFVLEALFLSVFGGILGLIFGIILSIFGCIIIGVDFILVSYSIPLALIFSAVIGLVFGYTPARKASRLNPIDALRSN